MNVLIWTLRALAALVYAASGVMKLFLFTQVSKDVPSFAALPRKAWTALGSLELLCVLGLVLPAALNLPSMLAAAAAGILALESLLFIWVHLKYRETGAILMSAVLGMLMGFLACWLAAAHP
jgi:hypothetical protein